jgi:virulence surface antigen
MLKDWEYDQGEILDNKGKAYWPGICLSLSYDWCKRILSGTTPKQHHYMDISPERAMSQQRAYRGDTAQTTLQWVEMLARGDKLNVAAQDIQGFSQLATPINSVGAGNACILGIPGHAVALFRKRTRVIFFDPNYGQYIAAGVLPGPQITKFLTKYYASDTNGDCQLRELSGRPRDHAHYS